MKPGSTDLADAIDKISPEDWCSDNGVDYRMTTGSSGAQLQIRECPRCGGSSWKVFLNAESGLGNCFHGACVGEPGFNIYTFAKAWLRLSPRATTEHIIGYAKTMGWRPKNARRYEKPVIPDEIDLPASVSLGKGNNIEYLEKRGVDGRWAEKFDLRYCESGYFQYINYQNQMSAQEYSDRIIIPIRDFDGKIVTFQGRDVSGKAEKKYLFPPGLPGTGKYLYNANRAKGKVDLVMGEGAFDVMAIEMAFEDFEEIGAIGSFGKSFSASLAESDDQLHQLALLKGAGAKSLTFMWDSENKTIADACDAAEKVLKIIPVVKIAVLPPGCDPNEVTAMEVRVAYAKAVVATKANILKLRMKYRG